MEIKKGLGLVLMVLGLATLQMQTVATSTDNNDTESSRRGRVFATEFSSERFHEIHEKNCQERSEKRAERRAERLKGHQHHDFCPDPATESLDQRLYFDLAIGSVKYKIPTTTIINSGGGANVVSLDHASWIPMLRGGFGAEFIGIPCSMDDDEGEQHTTRARVGFQVSFAKKNAAVTTFYTNTGFTSPNLLGVQDVFRGELLGVASYDVIRDIFSIEAGFGLVGGALKDFALFQPLTNAKK